MEKVTPIKENGILICPKCNASYVKHISECYSCGTTFYPSPKLTQNKEKSVNNEDDLVVKGHISDTAKNIIDVILICPECESNNNRKNRYCTNCGYEINPPEKRVINKCPKCDKEYNYNINFCPNDGTKLIKKEIIKIIDKDSDSTITYKKVSSHTTLASQEKFMKVNDTNYIIASTGQRFANFILDSIFIYIFAFLLGAFLVIIDMNFILEIYSEFWLGVLIYLTYFVNFEMFFNGRTPAKIITRTRAIKNDGSKLTFGSAFGRTLCRYIPFEVFSFLGDKGRPIGWHDSIPNTIVISTRK